MNIKSLIHNIFNHDNDKGVNETATTAHTSNNSPDINPAVAPDAQSNQQGEWRQLEQDIAEETENGSSVDYGMGINYAGNSFKPSSFDTKYTVNGTIVRRKSIANGVND